MNPDDFNKDDIKNDDSNQDSNPEDLSFGNFETEDVEAEHNHKNTAQTKSDHSNTGMPISQLVVQYQGQTVHAIKLQGVIKIGRLPENDLTLALPGVSRRHAEIRSTESGPVIVDLFSERGTYVAGNKLLPEHPYFLLPGVTVQIGPFVLTHQAGQSVLEEPLPTPSAAPVARAAKIEKAARPTTQFIPVNNAAALYMQNLPVIFHDQEFFHSFLKIFETVWEPLEWRQDNIAFYFDPRTAPERMVSWLADWVGMEQNPYWPEQRKRELASEAMDLYRWRGTTYGLARALELSTGLYPSVETISDEAFMLKVSVAIPKDSVCDEQTLHELICTHKPAACGYVLNISYTDQNHQDGVQP